jgi:hypothetical protein
VEQPSPNAKPLPAKSTRGSRPAARKPASQKPKSKASAAQVGTTVQLRKQKPKAAQQTSGETGLQHQTPASQPASQLRKPKSSTVQKTKAVASRKQTQKPAQPTNGKAGLQAVTPVPPIHQPAKLPAKAKQDRAKPTKAVLLSAPEQVAVQTHTAAQSGAPGKHKITVPKTRQPAKPALTKKPKAAALTSQVKKATSNKIAAPTRTVRSSKASGS